MNRSHTRNTETRSHRSSRLLALALALVLAVCAIPATAFAEVRTTDTVLDSTVGEKQLSVSQSPNIDAQYAILTDADGNVLFARDAYTPAKIASVTKIMTAIVALENSQLTDAVTISADAAEIGESTAGLQEGDVLDMKSALKALLVPSGNDAAVAIAETVGKTLPGGTSDPVAAFVALMNEKAAELGCADTVYENPHGLDDEEYAGNLHSTASDVAIVSRYAMSLQEIRDIVKGGSTTITVTRAGTKTPVELETTDLMLEQYSYTIGIKTGSTIAAGPCFSAAISRDGRELYAVVLNSSSEQQRFTDCIELFNWYFDHKVDYALCNTAETCYDAKTGASYPVTARVAHADWTDKTFAATFADTTATVEVFDLNGNVSQDFHFDEVHGKVKVGDKVGTVDFIQHNTVIATVDLLAAEDCAAPNPFEAIGIWFDRLGKGIFGGKTVADSVVVNTVPLINNKATAQ